MKLSTLYRIPLFLIALVVALVLALANRKSVILSLDPFSADTPALAFEVPLYLLLFLAVLLGVLIGGVAAWFGQGGRRKQARKTARENRQMEKDLARHQVAAEAAKTGADQAKGPEEGTPKATALPAPDTKPSP